jgi:hypothetical protein
VACERERDCGIADMGLWVGEESRLGVIDEGQAASREDPDIAAPDNLG